MFNENDGKWIGYYKTYTIVMFWLYAAAAVVMCILGWTEVFWWTASAFLDGLICLAGGLLLGFVQLVCNMLIIQLLNNVQTIRETITSRASKQEANSGLEELKKFKKLLDMNVITAEEYEAKKAQLLEQI